MNARGFLQFLLGALFLAGLVWGLWAGWLRSLRHAVSQPSVKAACVAVISASAASPLPPRNK